MSEKIVCQIPGNVLLQIEGHYKLMTLVYLYGADKIASLLEKAQITMQASGNIQEENFVDVDKPEDGLFFDETESADVLLLNEIEELNQLQNLTEAFKELKASPALILEEAE